MQEMEDGLQFELAASGCPTVNVCRVLPLHTTNLQLISPPLLLRRPRLPHLSQPPRDHTGNHLKHHLRSRQARLLPDAVISRRDLNDIGPDDVEPLNASQNADQFSGRPSARLGGAGAGRQAGIQDVDVDGQVYLPVCADAVHDGGNDAGGAEVVDVVGADAQEALAAVVVVVGKVVAGEAGAEAGVDGGAVGDEAFIGGQPEHGAVVEFALLGGPGAGVFCRIWSG